MSKEQKTQRVSFRVGKRQYTIIQELPKESAARSAPVVAAMAGLTRITFPQEIRDPRITTNLSGFKLGAYMERGDYLHKIQEDGRFPLHNGESNLTHVGIAHLNSSTDQVTVELEFKEIPSSFPTESRIKSTIDHALENMLYSNRVAIDSVEVIGESGNVQGIKAVYKVAIGTTGNAGGRMGLYEDLLCRSLTNHGLVRAFRPLIVIRSQFGTLDLSHSYSTYIVRQERVNPQYFVAGKWINHARIFLEAFHGRNLVSLEALRDKIFRTRKGDPRPLFIPGTQKATRDEFFRDFMYDLTWSGVLKVESEVEVDGKMVPTVWSLTSYGERVYSDLKMRPPSQVDPFAYYNI